MASGRIGSHNQHARPDGKMSRQHAETYTMSDGRVMGPYPKTGYRQATQKNANAKRRRRDKTETSTAWPKCDWCWRDVPCPEHPYSDG